MASMKITPPMLQPMGEEERNLSERPSLRLPVRRHEMKVEALVTSGFVAEAPLLEVPKPDDVIERITLELPRRLKRALQAEVSARKDDPDRGSRGSMKSVILEALSKSGFSDFIREADIEVQAGIFMKRQSAKMNRG